MFPPGCIVAVGLKSEAALLPPNVRAVVSGGDPRRLAALLAALPLDVTAVLSFGVAGGLAPGLATGEVLAASEIWDAGEIWPALWPHPLPGRTARLAASNVLLPDALAKAGLHRVSGALAVDMESGIAARFARERAIPFGALRAVADAAGDALPRAATLGLHPDGSPAPLRVLGALLRRPTDLPGLLRLARASARAHAALSRVLA